MSARARGQALLDLIDWRRRMAGHWETWRQGAATDPIAATMLFRFARDGMLKGHPQSPLPERRRRAFKGAEYWHYDPAWRLRGRLIPCDMASASGARSVSASASRRASMTSATALLEAALTAPAEVGLPWSATPVATLRRIGDLTLNGPLAGETLPAFWVEGYTGGLFVPFLDATSGTESYGAGRYLLDTAKSADHGVDPATGELILDFNMAFDPSCAYDPRWACPLAPPDSRLAMPIRVGERLPTST